VPLLFLQFQFNDSGRKGTMPIVTPAALPPRRIGLTGRVEPVSYWRTYGR
jgi:hypothetical protein